MSINSQLRALLVRFVVKVVDPVDSITSTAFFVNEKGFLLTCWHVVEPGFAGVVRDWVWVGYRGERYKAHVLKGVSNRNKDLAVLRVLGEEFQRLQYSGFEVAPLAFPYQPADPVAALGYQRHDMLADPLLLRGYLDPDNTPLTVALVDATGVMFATQQCLAVAFRHAHFDLGMSGAPLLDTHTSRVVGMVAGVLPTSIPTHQPLGFAVPLRDVPLSWSDFAGDCNVRDDTVPLPVPDMVGDELTLLQVLLVFAGGAARDALQFVWCGGQVRYDNPQAEKFRNACRAARDERRLDFKARRYDLDPLIRKYLEQCNSPDPNQRNHWARTHADYFLGYAQRLRQDYDALEREQLNFFAAMAWAEKEEHEVHRVGDFADYLFDFLWVRGFWDEAREHMSRAIAKLHGNPLRQARMLRQLGVFCRVLGDYEEARRYFEESLEKAKEPSVNIEKMLTLHELGVLNRLQGDYAEAQRCFDKSIRLAKRLRDDAAKARAVHELGVLRRLQGNYAQARRHFEESLALKEKLHDQRGKARTLHHLGVLCRLRGDYAEAEGHLTDCLSLETHLGDERRRARTLRELGVLSRVQRDYEEAQSYLEESLSLEDKLGDKRGKAMTLCELGVLWREGEDYTKARDRFDQSLALFENLGEKEGEAETLHNLAMLELLEVHINMAEDLFQRSLDLADRVGSPFWWAWNVYGLGLCAQAREQLEKANQLFEEALAIAERLPIPDLVAQVRAALEWLAHRAGTRKDRPT